MDFILFSLGLVALIVGVLVVLARAYPGSGADLVDWKPTRSYEDEARLESEDIQQMIEAQNEMRRRRGKRDVTILFWLLGSAAGEPELLEALHGPRLERLLEELVDTPVRGIVYEAAGSVPEEQLEGGAAIVRAASERWRIPSAVVDADPDD